MNAPPDLAITNVLCPQKSLESKKVYMPILSVTAVSLVDRCGSNVVLARDGAYAARCLQMR